VGVHSKSRHANLARYDWKYLVVDEGHRFKNCNCKLLRELKTLPVENKFLLSGTPLQNNLAEHHCFEASFQMQLAVKGMWQ
jgi:SNF2 family DNA or RNA helicase